MEVLPQSSKNSPEMQDIPLDNFVMKMSLTVLSEELHNFEALLEVMLVLVHLYSKV